MRGDSLSAFAYLLMSEVAGGELAPATSNPSTPSPEAELGAAKRTGGKVVATDDDARLSRVEITGTELTYGYRCDGGRPREHLEQPSLRREGNRLSGAPSTSTTMASRDHGTKECT